MGMGFSICKSIIEQHRGRLWAASRVPHGCIFSITLLVSAVERRMYQLSVVTNRLDEELVAGPLIFGHQN
jgi:hypothetical protein